MNTFGSTKSKINPKNILGGILGSIEEDFERETSAASSVARGIGGVFEALIDLGQNVTGTESKSESKEAEKFPSKGSIEFNDKQAQIQVEQLQKQQTERNRKKDFFQILEKSQEQVQRENERLFEEEINDIATNLPTEQKNQLLGYQASYRDRGNVYQRAELRKKLIEQRKQAEKKQKEAAAPKAKGNFSVGENELLMGGERSGGGHWSTTPG